MRITSSLDIQFYSHNYKSTNVFPSKEYNLNPFILDSGVEKRMELYWWKLESCYEYPFHHLLQRTGYSNDHDISKKVESEFEMSIFSFLRWGIMLECIIQHRSNNQERVRAISFEEDKTKHNHANNCIEINVHMIDPDFLHLLWFLWLFTFPMLDTNFELCTSLFN